MRVVREILPNGMPFIVQAGVEDGLIYPNKIKVVTRGNSGRVTSLKIDEDNI